jgi:hypothetical protein
MAIGDLAQLQTLISTLQNTNVQLGNLIKAIDNVIPTTGTTAGSATAGGGSALPATPAGYWIVNIPGTGNVKLPYYGL